MDFRLLGPLEVMADGQPIQLRAKERAVLAVLLLHANETVSSARLIDELWGEQPPVSAAKTLATYVWQLRKALGAETIQTRPPGYAAVVAPDRLDTARFDALVARARTEQPAEAAATLREALALWRGPALADVELESSARADVARLDDQRLIVLAQRLDHDLALGRHEQVLAELQALVVAHPFRERLRGQLMLALYRSGRQAEALDTYREARTRLVEELGIEPGPDLQRLERSILAQDPELDAPSGDSGTPVARAPRTRLPRPASRLVGRERELRAVLTAFESGARLVTLTGPGGSGKTRLALEVAHTLAPTFDGGAFWVGLAPLRDPSLVLAAAADAVGARNELAAYIGDQKLLLLVDNLEHVIDATPKLAALAATCPGLRLLVTSRERMHVRDELEYPVPPLLGSDAVALFCARAQLEPSPEIAELCSRLDNLPLAVELAAGRAKALSAGQILDRLSGRLDLFTGGRDADPRQRTLRATIEWSHDLLSPEERQLFARLAVFAGGCTLEAAAQVCDADLETLQALVEKSLVRFADERYAMLATIQDFAAERLAASGGLDATMGRLARYLIDLAHAQGAPLYLGREAEAYARLDLEHANVRAAVEWAIADSRLEHVAALVVALRHIWTSRATIHEVESWAEQALGARGEVADELWPHVLLSVAQVRREVGAPARALLVEAREALSHLDPQPYLDAMCLSELSWIASEEGRLDEARRFAEDSLALRAVHGLFTGRALTDLGRVALLEGELEEARRVLVQDRALSLASGFAYERACANRLLAEIARREGSGDAAGLAREALHGFAELGDAVAVAGCLKDLALLASEGGELDRAARLWNVGVALASGERSGRSQRLLVREEPAGLPEVEQEIAEPTLQDALALIADRSEDQAPQRTRP